MNTKNGIPLPFLGLATAFAILVAGCVPAESAVACDAPAINVTKTADTSDGMCSAADCSLREAVIRANTCAGAQTIQVPAGTYTLTRAGAGEDAASTGDLDLTDTATLMGTGRPVIDGNAQDRVFEVFPGVTAALSNFVIRNGREKDGAGIRSRGTLNVNESTIENNVAVRPAGVVDPAKGGGILSDGSGDLGVYLSEVNGNSADNGAGIAVVTGGAATPTVMISHTRIALNSAAQEGGGLWLDTGVETTAIRFEVDENTSGLNGNGIYNAGNLALTDGSIEQNTVGAAGATKGGGRKGGGIYNNTSGTVIARQILLQNNASGGGGGIYNKGMTHFYNSALVTNEATNGEGGGAFNFGAGAGLLMNNSTVSANIAIFGGGGIRNENGNYQLTFVTLSSNESEGINSSGSGEMTMRNTILDTNMDGNCAGTSPNSIGHNIDDGVSCGLDEPSDMPGTDPMLLPLAMNGGLTPTHAPADGSPAVDSADPDRCDGTDQRIIARPQGPNCDRGAYEKEPAVIGGTGSIGGIVWRELCALPDGPLPDTAPMGCIPWGGYYEANGILEAGEPGIPTVRVRLGSGVCPAFGAGTATTDAGGRYGFTGLAAGTYCISIDALSAENIPALIPGGWSFPVREVTVARAEVVLADGESKPDVNFGWDYQFDAGWPEATPTPTMTPLALAFGKPWFSTDHLFYYYGGQCTPLEVKFQISITNPAPVESINMFFQLEDKASGEKTPWSPGFSMNPLGGGFYTRTVPALDIPGSNSFAEAWLRYQFVASDKGGAALLHSDVFHDVTISRCGKPTTR